MQFSDIHDAADSMGQVYDQVVMLQLNLSITIT